MVGVFIVLYLMNVRGRTALEVGTLLAIQKAATIVGYVPTAWFGDRYSRKPCVIVSFVSYALFPLALVLSNSFTTLVLAFLIGGLKQAGEPARKAMLVDLTEKGRRGRTVGLYYVKSSLATAPAALIGGLLWSIRPDTPFFVACFLGLLGTVIFIVAPDQNGMIPATPEKRLTT
jgi:MFS family permease